jgi:chaperone required for assembly of F1-ATPase
VAAPERPAATRRFYAAVASEAAEEGFALTLDGRRARTPGRSPLVLPTHAMAQAVAAEWEAQGDTIRPDTMPLTRLANTAIDGVAPRLVEVRDEVVRYAGSDLVLYRAGEPDRLVALQAEAWDPVLDWARDALGARFILSQGVTWVAQPELSLSRIRALAERESSPFRVAALNVATTLTGSALLALMLADGAISPEAAWAAAHVDESFQESRWGTDAEALARRAGREREFRSSAAVLEFVPR